MSSKEKKIRISFENGRCHGRKLKKKNKKKTANKKQQQQQQQQKESLTDVPLLNDRYIGLEDVDVVVVFQRCDVTAPAAAAAAAAANGV